MKVIAFLSLFFISLPSLGAGMPQARKVTELVQKSKILSGDEFQSMEMIQKRVLRAPMTRGRHQVFVNRTYEVQGKYCTLEVKVQTYFQTFRKRIIGKTRRTRGKITRVACVSKNPPSRAGNN